MDAATFGADVVEAVRSFLEQEVDPLLVKIEALQSEVDRLKALPLPPTESDIDKLIKSEVFFQFADRKVKEVDERLAAGPQPDIKALLAEAVAAIPPAEAGKDADPELIKQMVADAVAALPPAEKGKDADPVDMAAQIAEEVQRAVAALPVAKDGQSVTLDDVRPMIEEAVTKAVTLIPVPKDGVNGKDGRDGLDVVKFIRDDRGHLNGILRDGTTVDLGEYVGKDGAPGERGKDGRDGVSYDGIEEAIEDGGRFLVRRHKLNGEVVSEQRFLMGTMIYRGVFKEGQTYTRGDTVTWGGSLWHCDADGTDDKPDGVTKSWTLASKRGRDGKDGATKPPTKPGPVKVG